MTQEEPLNGKLNKEVQLFLQRNHLQCVVPGHMDGAFLQRDRR